MGWFDGWFDLFYRPVPGFEARFGVEIEMVVAPRFEPIQPVPLSDAFWRDELANRLKMEGLNAGARDAAQAYQNQYPEHYDKWFITKDGSLRTKYKYEVPLEAVSPTMAVSSRDCSSWLDQIDRFWKGTCGIFEVMENTSCGAHVHVSPVGRKYDLEELKRIAYAAVAWEPLVEEILPAERHGNQYCQSAADLSEALSSDLEDGGSINDPLYSVRCKIRRIKTPQKLFKYIQGQNRYALWNFKNTVSHTGTGTIEFRGGQHLRGKVGTKRLIGFVVSFISLALQEDWDHLIRIARITDVDVWWQKILSANKYFQIPELPKEYSRMMDAEESHDSDRPSFPQIPHNPDTGPSRLQLLYGPASSSSASSPPTPSTQPSGSRRNNLPLDAATFYGSRPSDTSYDRRPGPSRNQLLYGPASRRPTPSQPLDLDAATFYGIRPRSSRPQGQAPTQ